MPPNASPGPVPDKAATLTRDMLPALYDMGDNAIRVRRLAEASWCFDRARGFDPRSPRPFLGLSQIRDLEGRHPEARAMIREAMKRGAEAAQCYALIALSHQFEGNTADAITAYEQAIRIDPTHTEAQLRVLLLRPAPDSAAHVAELTRLEQRADLSDDQRAALGFALGQTHADAGAVDAAFAAYARGNRIRHAQYPCSYDMGFLADRTIATCTGDMLRNHPGSGNQATRPVFVVGMMRSGTTLLEQVLDTHPQIHGHGERNDILQIANAMPTASDNTSYPDCMPRVPPPALALCASEYLAPMLRDAPNALRSVDKLPHNFAHLGLISLLFPQARIIHCSRDAIDTCLSNYFLDYGARNDFTYDLAQLGRYYRSYERLMVHWEKVLPNPILTVPYEGMVSDLEGWARKAVDFLGLAWDPACLDFHNNRRSVLTKSLSQVRRPIYQTSIGRWQPYAHHLGPLFAALALPIPTKP